MCRSMAHRLFALLACLAVATSAFGQTVAPKPPDAIERLVARLEQALAGGDRAALQSMTARDTDAASFDEFVSAAGTNATRVVVKERDRLPLDNGKQQILLEVFVERGMEGSLATWRMDLRPPVGRTDPDWRIEGLEPVSTLSGLFRLSLNTSRQFDIRNLVLVGTDLTPEMSSGIAFVAEVTDGPTATVLLGRGRMRFAPPDEAERTQVRIFAGADELVSEFDAAFIRVRPAEFESRFRAESLVPRTVVPADARRASELFEEYIGRSLQLDLTDLSRDRWSLIPSSGDLIGEIRTRKFGSLTYARSGNEAEDVTVFDRRRRRNISIYASAEKLAARPLLAKTISSTTTCWRRSTRPSHRRYWINGNAHLRVRVRSGAMTDDDIEAGGAADRARRARQGRPPAAPARGQQNSVIVNLPIPGVPGQRVQLDGRLQWTARTERAGSRGHPRRRSNRASASRRHSARAALICSNNSFWYPQSTVTTTRSRRCASRFPASSTCPPAVRERGRRSTPSRSPARIRSRRRWSCSRTIGPSGISPASSAA